MPRAQEQWIKEPLVDYHLDRKIKLSEKSEYKNLYSWSLQEFNEKGEKLGSDQVPWEWGLYFSASELRYSRSIAFEGDGALQVEESESIAAVLRSGTWGEERWLDDETSYSMFGTNRTIKEFNIVVTKADNGDEEKCRVWGCVSYTTEVDFREETVDDTVQIYLSIYPERFDAIKEQVQSRRVDCLQIRLRRVSGFYSEWSPSTRARNIKVLTASSDQEVLTKDGSKIEPPRLGDVGEFNITLTRGYNLPPKQERKSDDNATAIGRDDYQDADNDGEEHWKSPTNRDEALLMEILRSQAALNSLRIPIWLIFIILCIVLIKGLI